MADWRQKAEIVGDVVYFGYVQAETQKLEQEVYVWDLDKTYLDTSWGSIRELAKTALEKAFQKKNIPGTATLVRALTSVKQVSQSKSFPIFFITASPPQIERKIREKLKLDGIFPFGAFYKDNLKNLTPNRLWRLTQQVGYKIQALLQLRLKLHPEVRLVLWGDDSESDAVIYSLFSDICARRLTDRQLAEMLKALHVTGEQLKLILELQKQLPESDPVDKIYINLAVDTDAEYYIKFGRRVVPTENSFQAALDLYQDDRLRSEQVIKVAQDLIMNYEYTSEEIERSFDNLVRRKLLSQGIVAKILPLLQEQRFISTAYVPSVPPVENSLSKRPLANSDEPEEHSMDPWVPERIDYLNDYR